MKSSSNLQPGLITSDSIISLSMDEVKASERQVIPILLLYFAAYEFIKESREVYGG